MSGERTTVAGVDGCRDGWIAALVDDGWVAWRLLQTAADVVDLDALDVAVVGVDVPIGLPESGRRRCDLNARDRLPGRASTVFLVPPRAALQAGSYEAGCQVAQRLSGAKFSRQLWGIAPRIRDIDAELTPDLAERVVEVHPEVSFAALNGAPLPRKTTARGVGKRIAALRPYVDAAVALAAVPPGVAVDDALDALAAAWTADRWRRGAAEVLGGERDGHGLPMRIVV